MNTQQITREQQAILNAIGNQTGIQFPQEKYDCPHISIRYNKDFDYWVCTKCGKIILL